jgi:Domain of unknown function (DUF1989)
VANINLFMNVPVLADGSMGIVDGKSKPGDSVELRAETRPGGGLELPAGAQPVQRLQPHADPRGGYGSRWIAPELFSLSSSGRPDVAAPASEWAR